MENAYSIWFLNELGPYHWLWYAGRFRHYPWYKNKKISWDEVYVLYILWQQLRMLVTLFMTTTFLMQPQHAPPVFWMHIMNVQIAMKLFQLATTSPSIKNKNLKTWLMNIKISLMAHWAFGKTNWLRSNLSQVLCLIMQEPFLSLKVRRNFKKGNCPIMSTWCVEKCQPLWMGCTYFYKPKKDGLVCFISDFWELNLHI